MGAAGQGLLLVFCLLIPFVCCKFVYVQPNAACEASNTCNGRLATPFPTIREAIESLQHLVSVNTVVLFPGTYVGPNNTDLWFPNTGIFFTLLGWDYKTTTIDCQGKSIAFSLAFVYAGLTDITIANCVGVNGGGLYANQVGLYLEDTRWINNTADVGGAVFLNWGEGTFTGVNEFVNNTASIAAGAVCGNYVTFFHFDAADVITSGNYAPVGTPSNYYMDQFGGIHYLGSTVPTYAVGPNVPNPVYYVDSRVDCTRVLCNGSAEYPYGTLNNATNALYWIGGTLNIMPGVYTGPDNIQLTFSDANVVVQQWPNTTGQVILDCQNEGWGIWLYDLAITISDITIQNCNNLNRPKGTTGFGGGAILGEYTMTILTNVHFINNTATVGSGGAMFMNLSQLIVDGGSFVNNTAAEEGGAVMMSSAVGRFSNNVLFEANTINRTENQDLSCFKAELQNDGSVTFAVGQDVNCFVSITSPTATAVFPGSLQGVLYPKNSAGATQADMFASLNFLSIVELDHTGHPIESTRLHKHDLEWILTVSNNSDSANSVTLEYDALGPNHEFIALIHTFFIDDGMYHAMGVPQPIAVPAGVIKTSIEVAMWPFQSHKHSLSITLSGTTPAPITSLKQHMAADQSAEVRFETADLTVLFSALPVAVYDSLTNVGKVTLTTKQYSPTAVHFEFVFSYFELWTGYDPQFSVLLGGTESSSGGEDSSSASMGTILGLSLGLTGGVCCLVLLVIVLAGVVTTALRIRMRRRVLGRVHGVTKASSNYAKLEEEGNEEPRWDSPGGSSTTSTRF